MSRLRECFLQLQRHSRKALVPYLTAGDPCLTATYDLALACVRAGADVLELGVPFSAPLADGPTIQEAVKRALAAGTTLAGTLETVKRLRQETDTPVVLLVYYNTICRRGNAAFAALCADAGVDALVVPDLPVDESADLAGALKAHGLDLVQLVAPTSTAERRERLAALASGFIYCVSVTGVTGARKALDANLEPFLLQMREMTSVPLVVGFGISTPQMAVAAAAHADGVIVGSALVGEIAAAYQQGGIASAVQAAEHFLAPFRTALDLEYGGNQ